MAAIASLRHSGASESWPMITPRLDRCRYSVEVDPTPLSMLSL